MSRCSGGPAPFHGPGSLPVAGAGVVSGGFLTSSLPVPAARAVLLDDEDDRAAISTMSPPSSTRPAAANRSGFLRPARASRGRPPAGNAIDGGVARAWSGAVAVSAPAGTGRVAVGGKAAWTPLAAPASQYGASAAATSAHDWRR